MSEQRQTNVVPFKRRGLDVNVADTFVRGLIFGLAFKVVGRLLYVLLGWP